MHSTPVRALAWTYEPIDLGRCRFGLAREGVRVTLEVYDGGGFVPGHAIWRVAGRIVAITDIAQT